MQNDTMYEWGDLSIFLAIVRRGSTLAAARVLGMNQTTVARRVAALEAALGLRLFDRRQDGYRPTEAAAALILQAERVELEAETLTRLAARQNRNLAGSIRVTTTEDCAIILTPWLSEFMELYPDIRVEVIGIDRRLDLGRGEADIAIRVQQGSPTEPGIVFRRLASTPWGIYCSEAYAARHGLPDTSDALNAHMVIGADGVMATWDPFVWLVATAPRATVRHICASLATVLAAIKAGHGIGLLPRPMVVEPDLVECFDLPDFGYQFYLVTAETLKDRPRVRAFNDFIVARASTLRLTLEGRPRR